VDLAAIQLIAPVGDEHVRRDRPSGPPSIPSREVVGQHATGGQMDGDQTGFAELTTPNRQHTRSEIDILKLKTARFAEAQARDAQ